MLDSVNEEPVNTYILNGSHHPFQDVTVGAYGIVNDHQAGERDRPIFLGLYSTARIGDRLSYWFDGAFLRGRAGGSKLRGYGFDLLGVYRWDGRYSPRLILGYAFGSGDSKPDDDRDTAFRQTGLQGNEFAVGGLTSFRYYGEAFDPELANMSIFTAGIGAGTAEGFSLDLVYHAFRQIEKSDELRDSALDAEPTGQSRQLCSEIDIVVGFEDSEDFQVRGFLGYFMAGRAFGAGADDALFARIEFEYSF